ncbi:MAG: hypothetical protein AAF490_05515 [Chloroflexota bacterium]
MRKASFILIILYCLVGCQSQPATAVPETAVSEPASTAIPTPIVGPSGRLIFIEVDVGSQYISEYDLQSKTVRRLFTAPENGWVSQIDILTDSEQLLMAYASPPPDGEIQFGYTDIYLTAPDETAVPTFLIQREQPEGLVFNPVWSPEQQYVYYSRVTPNSEDSAQFKLFLERYEVESGESIQIAPEGIWPAVSPANDKISYVTVDPQSLGNALWLANPDGGEARQLVPEGEFEVVDVPLFSPDGEWVYFTAAENRETAVSWWHRLVGVKTASAHNIPSDWYRISAAGGDYEQLTAILETGIYGDFSPDGQLIAFATFNGLYLMKPDGSELEKILDIGATTSLSWVR